MGKNKNLVKNYIDRLLN